MPRAAARALDTDCYAGRVTLRPLVLVLAFACFAVLPVVAAPALAQVLLERDLGGGCSVRQTTTFASCWGSALPCIVWVPTGFSFAGIEPLGAATAFARVPATGRIVAAIRGSRRSWPSRTTGVLYTDDLGATWSAARWTWPSVALALAFEPASERGVAAGAGGYVWTTEDGGTTWTDRGSSSGTTYVDAARLEHTVVLVDDHGAAWRSRDGGFARESLADGVVGPLTVDVDAITVTTASHSVRVARDGSVRRTTL